MNDTSVIFLIFMLAGAICTIAIIQALRKPNDSK